MKRRSKGAAFLTSEGVEVPFIPGQTVLEALKAAEVDITNVCEGMGTCGTCRFYVESDLDSLPPRNEIEQERASVLGFFSHERLACQLEAFTDLVVRIPKSKD